MGSEFAGEVAVVTGAASGIGRALAHALAGEGAALALADVNETGLRETAAQIKNAAATITTHVVDVASQAAVEAFAGDVIERHGRVTLLVNNAGVALYGTFEELSMADFEWLVGINFWGQVYGVKHFLPVLRQQRKAAIVNMSSVYGLIAPPGQSAYSASKFAVRGFTEALRHELQLTSVQVIAVHPAGVRTPIVRNARIGAGADPASAAQVLSLFERVLTIPPEAAAARIIQGIKKRESRILIGKEAVRIDRVQRLRPVHYWKTMMKRIEKLAGPAALRMSAKRRD
jgi:short-subunit dehydrogenase